MQKLPILTAVVTSLLIVPCVSNGSIKGQRSRSAQRLKSSSAPVLIAQNDKKRSSELKSKESRKGTVPRTETVTATLKEARDRLIRYKSVKAQIVETVAIGRRKFQLVGSYLQGTNLRLRLEYKIKIGESEGSLLEVCDGQVLWTRTVVARRPSGTSKVDTAAAKFSEDVHITRRDVRKILEHAAAGNVSGNMLSAELGLGGVPSLLASLENTMNMDTKTIEYVDKKSFTVIQGTWNDHYKQRFIKGNPLKLPQLPDYVPDRVKVYFDSETLFPRRILYEKKVPNRKIYRPMVVLDFTKVDFNISVDDKEFEFIPPDGASTNDVTEQYLQQLRPAKTSQELQQTNEKELSETKSN